MELNRLSRQSAKQIWGKWLEGGPVTESVDLSRDERDFRGKFISYVEKAGGCSTSSIDPHLALELYYRLLPLQTGCFTLSMAADDSIWRTLTMRVVPDYVAKRWGIKETGTNGETTEQSPHFWSQPQRNWLKALWWYCHFADHGDLNEGKASKLLKSITSHTDPIQGLVERPGRQGYDVAVNRELLSRLADKTMSVQKFKKLLKLNTAACKLTLPMLCERGIAGYVDSLIQKLDS
jgi:hypothetical protein